MYAPKDLCSVLVEAYASRSSCCKGSWPSTYSRCWAAVVRARRSALAIVGSPYHDLQPASILEAQALEYCAGIYLACDYGQQQATLTKLPWEPGFPGQTVGLDIGSDWQSKQS